MICCRTAKTRIEIFEKYNLTPIAHVKLLNGQKRKSCTNDELIDSYYYFGYEAKNKTESGDFLCGSHAANHFLELMNLEKLPLFNPLATIETEYTGANTSSGEKRSNEKWNGAAKQLHNAINILVVYSDKSPGKVIREISAKLLKNKHKEPDSMTIKSVNTIIKQQGNTNGLQGILSELKVQNPNLREFKFDLLTPIFHSNKKYESIPSYFGLY